MFIGYVLTQNQGSWFDEINRSWLSDKSSLPDFYETEKGLSKIIEQLRDGLDDYKETGERVYMFAQMGNSILEYFYWVEHDKSLHFHAKALPSELKKYATNTGGITYEIKFT